MRVALFGAVPDDHEGSASLGPDGLGQGLDLPVRITFEQGLADARYLGDGSSRLQGCLADLLAQHLFGQAGDDVPADRDLNDDQGQHHVDQVGLDGAWL